MLCERVNQSVLSRRLSNGLIIREVTIWRLIEDIGEFGLTQLSINKRKINLSCNEECESAESHKQPEMKSSKPMEAVVCGNRASWRKPAQL